MLHLFKLPMHKNTTTLNKTDLNHKPKRSLKSQKLEPKDNTLNLILQFSRTYKVEHLQDNQYVELFLN